MKIYRRTPGNANYAGPSAPQPGDKWQASTTGNDQYVRLESRYNGAVLYVVEVQTDDPNATQWRVFADDDLANIHGRERKKSLVVRSDGVPIQGDIIDVKVVNNP